MIKVLIADDESWVRREIRKTIEYNSSFTVVGEAEDGESALEIAKEKKPNLILVGIGIPIVYEINLIEELKRELDNPVIIIISGHDQFNYDQIRCKMNVFDYILKPIDRRELVNKLDKAKMEFQRRYNEKYVTPKLECKLKNNDDLKNVFLKNWVRGKVKSDEIENEMKYFNIEYTKNMGIIIVRVIEGNKIKKDTLDLKSKILRENLESITNKLKEEFTYINVFEDTRNQIVILCDITEINKWCFVESILERYIYNELGVDVFSSSSFLRNNPIQINVVYKSICNRLSEAVKKNNIIIEVQKYIKRNYNKEDISLVEVSNKFEVSQAFIIRMFKRELGTTFSEYLINQRIKGAIILMRGKDMDIETVSRMAGYESVQYFKSIFKKRVGISPNEYKIGLNSDNDIS